MHESRVGKLRVAPDKIGQSVHEHLACQKERYCGEIDMQPSLEIRNASLADQRDALALVLADVAHDQRQRRIDELLAGSRTQPLAGLWVAYSQGRLIAAVLAQVEPGHTALVKVPCAAGASQTACDALLQRVGEELDRGGVRLARALTKQDNGPDAQALARAGFRHVCQLVYLVSLRASFPTSPPDGGLTFESFAGNERRLGAVVERTYAGSLDCPAIDAVRPIDDVLAGYRASGVFDPARWLIASREGVDVGCLLIADWPQNDQWELIYMGVVPEARGRGYGVAVVRQAQWLAGCAGRQRLVLAVDTANEPAMRVYAAAGFIPWDQRDVYVCAT